MPGSSSSDRGAGWVWGQFALIAVILALGVLPPRWPEWVRVLGVLFLLAGVAGFVWAARTLGGSFTAYPRPRAGRRARRGRPVPARAAPGLRRRPPRPVRLRVAHERRGDGGAAGDRGPVVAEVERRGTASGGALSGVRRLQAPGAAPHALARRRYPGGVSATWPEPVERVAAYLRGGGRRGAAGGARVPDGDRRGRRARRRLPLAQIVKSIVVVCDDRPVMALVPGDRRADLDKIARAANAAGADRDRRRGSGLDGLRAGRRRPVSACRRWSSS